MVTQSHPDRPGGLDLSRIGVTLAALLVYRLGLMIPVPGIDQTALASLMHSGWFAIERLSLFTLGLVPLLSVYLLAETLRLVSPRFARWQAEPANGRRLGRWLRLAALVLAVIQSFGVASALEGIGNIVATPGPAFRAGVVGSLVAATALLSWLADTVTRRGLGNGFWLLLAVPTVAGLVAYASETLVLHRNGVLSDRALLATAAYLLLGTAALVGLDRGRVSGAAVGFSVWPPLLAYTAIGWVVAAIQGPRAGDPTHWASPGQPAYIAGVAVLILAFALRQGVTPSAGPLAPAPAPQTPVTEAAAGMAPSRGADAEAATGERRLRLAALAGVVQVAICAAGEILMPLSPLAIPGMWLVVVVAVALGILGATRRGADAIRNE